MQKQLQLCGHYKELLVAFNATELPQQSYKANIIIIILLTLQIKELGFREGNWLA